MTDRHAGYIVILREDIREDDAQAIMTALRMVSGVAFVEPVIASYEQVMARSRRDVEWVDAIAKLAKDMTSRLSPP
jgi:hypothetical protein